MVQKVNVEKFHAPPVSFPSSSDEGICLGQDMRWVEKHVKSSLAFWTQGRAAGSVDASPRQFFGVFEEMKHSLDHRDKTLLVQMIGGKLWVANFERAGSFTKNYLKGLKTGMC